jgi:mono/diheme cytochrome c family protein
MPALGVDRGGPLADTQIRAIIGYLKELASAPTGPVNAQAIFESRCVACHGKDGNQIEGIHLQDKGFLEQLGDATITSSIANGRAGMPAFGKERGGALDRREIKALLDFLKSQAQQREGGPTPAPAEGKELFLKNCASCHGKGGGALPNAPLGSKAFLSKTGEAELFQATREGKGGMPALGQAKGGPLSDEQIRSIIQYLQSVAK